MSIIEQGNTIVDIFTGVNNAANNWFIYGILLNFFIIFLIIFHKEDMRSVFLADSFITFILGSMFFALGWINFAVLIIPIILIFIGIFMYMFVN